MAEACSEGDVNAVRKLLIEGRSVNEHTEEGESLLCLACSAGYYELAQVCIIKIKLVVFYKTGLLTKEIIKSFQPFGLFQQIVLLDKFCVLIALLLRLGRHYINTCIQNFLTVIIS